MPSSTEILMNVAEGYLEMLQKDLRDARESVDLDLAFELEEVISQLENTLEAREEVDLGVERFLNEGGGQLNEVISLLNEEYTRERRDYLDYLVATNIQFMESLGGVNNMVIDPESGLAIYSLGMVSLVTGAMYLLYEY